MKAKITAPNGVTIELDDAQVEDIERIAASVQRDIKPAFAPITPTIGSRCQRCHQLFGVGTGMCSGLCSPIWLDPTVTYFSSEVPS